MARDASPELEWHQISLVAPPEEPYLADPRPQNMPCRQQVPPEAIRRILDCLGLSSRAPPMAEAATDDGRISSFLEKMLRGLLAYPVETCAQISAARWAGSRVTCLVAEFVGNVGGSGARSERQKNLPHRKLRRLPPEPRLKIAFVSPVRHNSTISSGG